jgi:hypothetical protein
MLECSSDAIDTPHRFQLMAVNMYNNWQGRPDVQHLPHRFSPCAKKLQVEATWRCKDKTSPSPAHMYQCKPCLQIFDSKVFDIFIGHFHIEGEYFKEWIIGD